MIKLALHYAYYKSIMIKQTERVILLTNHTSCRDTNFFVGAVSNCVIMAMINICIRFIATLADTEQKLACLITLNNR